MIKQFLLSTVVVVMLLASFVCAYNANIDFTHQPTVVKDVPFNLVANLNSNGDKVMSLDFYITADGPNKFSSASLPSGRFLASVTPDKNEKLSDVLWHLYLSTSTNDQGLIADSSSDAKPVISVRTTITGTTTFSLNIADSKVSHENDGFEFDLIVTDAQIEPSNSVCGDGVVGYLDGYDPATKQVVDVNKDGIWQRDIEPVEACDDGTFNGGPGCIRNCQYIDTWYKVSSGKDCTTFGSINCALDPMTATEKFLAKVNALAKGECFPNPNHPNVYNCGQTRVPIVNGKIPNPPGYAIGRFRLVGSFFESFSEFLISLR